MAQQPFRPWEMTQLQKESCEPKNEPRLATPSIQEQTWANTLNLQTVAEQQLNTQILHNILSEENPQNWANFYWRVISSLSTNHAVNNHHIAAIIAQLGRFPSFHGDLPAVFPSGLPGPVQFTPIPQDDSSSLSKKRKASCMMPSPWVEPETTHPTKSGLPRDGLTELEKKVFSCKICDKSYSSLGALKMHIRTHTLPCKCHICGKAFSRPWLLQGHIRTHTGEKPFVCTQCDRAFADRSNLRAHLQTHEDKKRFACASCAKTFSRVSLLDKHVCSTTPGNATNTSSLLSQL